MVAWWAYLLVGAIIGFYFGLEFEKHMLEAQRDG